MTREEAIQYIDGLRCEEDFPYTDTIAYFLKERNEAIDMAIEALSVAELKSNFESAVPNCQKCAIKELWQEIEKEDLVSVVRCKDCKWQKFIDWGMGDCLHPKGSKHIAYDNHYCSYGERKE